MIPLQPPSDPALTALVLDNIDRAIIALDRDGQVTLFNPAAEAYLGRAARHVLGRRFEELFAGQEALLYLVRAALRDGRSITDDESIFLQRPKAAPLPVSVYAAPIFSRSGQQDGAVLIVRDLSRARELEDTCAAPTSWRCWPPWRPDSPMRSRIPWAGSRGRPSCWRWSLATTARCASIRG